MTGDVSCIGIRHDFDGMTHPFRRCAESGACCRGWRGDDAAFQ
jgi:hypothetical protein